ncbi:hermansky-Pudlak syndrome 1 protein [Thecamonas trahens ATCC 50062]|uniref:Hermansky-Pudlak syndrome 1 protein n=1 Tax=Thecamonas trahens ATCC 50062 TaxID=461836 RepID=A0A0L0DN58_THETB|nr:hermansky-Pudlak syndrome 1 protein [Thecamonas trahens ATCC 50062]KNC53456.1 hermansky-Pudlak syndrome 1 protein [Thecamonas trahens ATCC 50062]|eukprot:XP_013761780.1 hermansky-Pudlak syndrome 1 protein [Thecamonas trahens ATCC 50062]
MLSSTFAPQSSRFWSPRSSASRSTTISVPAAAPPSPTPSMPRREPSTLSFLSAPSLWPSTHASGFLSSFRPTSRSSPSTFTRSSSPSHGRGRAHSAPHRRRQALSSHLARHRRRAIATTSRSRRPRPAPRPRPPAPPPPPTARRPRRRFRPRPRPALHPRPTPRPSPPPTTPSWPTMTTTTSPPQALSPRTRASRARRPAAAQARRACPFRARPMGMSTLTTSLARPPTKCSLPRMTRLRPRSPGQTLSSACQAPAPGSSTSSSPAVSRPSSPLKPTISASSVTTADEAYATPTAESLTTAARLDASIEVESALYRSAYDTMISAAGGERSGGVRPTQAAGTASAGGANGDDDDDDDDDDDEVFVDAKGKLTPRDARSRNTSFDELPPLDDAPPDSLLETVFLHVNGSLVPGRLYCALLAPNTSLVLVSERVAASEAEAEQAHAAYVRQLVQRQLETFVDFLVIKAQAHITMLSYLYYFPGMVHFMFVDRTHEQVTAPTIIPLHGRLAEPDSSTGPEPSGSVAFIKARVWDLARHAHEALAAGFTSLALYKDGLCYSYHLVAENGDGESLPISLPATPQGNALELNALKSVIAAQHPDVRHLRVYELYALYVGTLPLESIGQCNARLLSMIREDRSLRVLRTLEHYNVSWY